MSNQTNEIILLLQRAKNGDEDSKDEIVKRNLPLVWSLVNRFKHHYYDKEDLFQVGCYGLLKAIDKFDFKFEVAFSTYAVPIILGEIKKYFRDEGSIKVSRSLKELSIKVNNIKDKLQQEKGCEPSIDEIAIELKVEKNDVVMAIESSFYPTSLNEPIFEKNGSTISVEDCIYSDDNSKIIDMLTLEKELSKLDQKEKLIINLRFYQGLNQEEIAKRFNVSQVQISRLEKKIIQKLRKEFV